MKIDWNLVIIFGLAGLIIYFAISNNTLGGCVKYGAC